MGRTSIALAFFGASIGGCVLSLGGLTGGSGASDAGSAESGSADAGAEASGPFCANLSSAPFVCDDFDFDNGVFTRIWETAKASGAQLQFDSTESASPPYSLLASLPANDGGIKKALLQKMLPLSGAGLLPQALHVELDLDRTPCSLPSAQSRAGFVRLEQTLPDGGEALLTFQLRPSGTAIQLSDGLGNTASSPLGPPVPNGWVHVVVDIRICANGADPLCVVSLRMDGVPGTTQWQTATVSSLSAPETLVGVGVESLLNPTPCAVHIDNVVIEIR